MIAAYNEAACIRAKLASALEAPYPRDRIEVIVVSDVSSDATDRLVAEYGDARFAPGALARLAAPFADEHVGLVSGHGLYAAPRKSGDTDDRDAGAVAN